ncbi:MAG: hypothetical protein JXR83_22175 [Deltaproteobacteria bacterium]|nr:hypothetical protein [Deltaproteobacteria bacterium]
MKRLATTAIVIAIAAAIVAAVLLLDRGVRNAASVAAPGASPGASIAHGAAMAAAGTAVPVATADPRRVREIFKAPWGNKLGELGRDLPGEGSPQGPMSFVVDASGQAYVLDQVNSRLQIFKPGQPPRAIPLANDGYQDIALTSRDEVALLDRLVTKSVDFVDDRGQVRSSVPLAGEGIEETGSVTAMFAQDDGIWVEVQHSRLVRVASADGKPDPERPTVIGRFSYDGTLLLTAAVDGDNAAVVITKPVTDPLSPAGTLLARVPFAQRLSHLLALDSDLTGRIFLGAYLIQPKDDGSGEVIAFEQVVVLGRDGRELGRIALPPHTGPEETFRRIAVDSDGTVYQLGLDESGATLRGFSP